MSDTSLAYVDLRDEGAGLEVRHEENLREQYAITLREWSANLEQDSMILRCNG